jgi:high-affinity nickel permease
MLSSNTNNLAEKKNIANKIIDFITGLNNQTVKVTMIICFIIALITSEYIWLFCNF